MAEQGVGCLRTNAERVRSRDHPSIKSNTLSFPRYGRLGVSGTVLSKRKITKLVNEGYVRSWDDPRLYTLPALRRRGVPPGAILSFVNELGVTKATTIIEIQRFESSVRKYLEATVPRLMLVLDPVKVVIDELPDAHLDLLEMPFSKDPAYGVSVLLCTLEHIGSVGLHSANLDLVSQSTVYKDPLHRTW